MNEILLYNYNALLAIIMGSMSWYASVEIWLNTRLRARKAATLFFFFLGCLNLLNGFSKILENHLLTQVSLLFFFPLTICLFFIGFIFRYDRIHRTENVHKIDLSLKVGVLRLNPELKILWASPGIEHIVSFTSEELIGLTLGDKVHPESKQTITKFKQEVKNGNLPFDLEVAIKSKKGTKIWLQFANNREFNNEGVYSGILCGIKNITERKRLEDEAFLLKNAIHSLPIGITISTLDENRIIQYINHTEAIMHGYRYEELIGQPVKILTPEALWPLFHDYLTVDLLNGLTRETLNVKKNGDFFPISLQTSVVRDQQNQPRALVSVSEPLIEPTFQQKTLYSALNDLPSEFQQFLKSKGNQLIMMIFFGRDREVITCNKATINNLGFTLQELKDDIDQVCATPTDLRKAIDRVFHPTRQIVTLQIQTKHRGIKTQYWLGFHAIHGTLAMGFEKE